MAAFLARRAPYNAISDQVFPKTSIQAIESIEMFDFVTVAKVGDIDEGHGRAYPVNGRMVAVFLHKGEYHAIDDFCPHMGASLAGGYVEGGVVTCPWHAWRFSICDGTWCDNPRIKIDCFEVRVSGDDIQVRVKDRGQI